jgi:hypothetical protein
MTKSISITMEIDEVNKYYERFNRKDGTGQRTCGIEGDSSVFIPGLRSAI